MAKINITDNLALNADLTLRDGCAFDRAGIKHLVASAGAFANQFQQPLDQAPLTHALLGATATSPNLLSGSLPTLTLGAGMNAAISVHTAADKSLFGDTDFSPRIDISAGQAWVAFGLTSCTTAAVAATVNAVGVKVAGGTKFSTTTYLRFASIPPAPLPALGEALAQTLSSFSLTSSAADVRAQIVGTVNRTEISGSITTTVSWSLPYTVNALASASLPFNTTVSLQPTVTVALSGSLAITGDFVMRCFKDTAEIVQIGIYKQKGTTFTASFTAAAAVGADVGSTDLLGTVLNKALPGVDTAKAGLSGDDAKALNQTIKAGLDRSIGVQLNATCSAAYTDEAAVVYEIRLDQGDKAATDHALDMALAGDWSALAALAIGPGANVRLIRDITVRTTEQKWTMTLNLFGVYNATSLTDYVRTSTMLVDDKGQLSLIDKADVSRISASSAPYASDDNKLIKALMQDFVVTASYALVGGKLGLDLKVVQSYLDYQRTMSLADVEENLLLADELGLIPAGSLDASLAAAGLFAHACFRSTVSYDNAGLMALFFSDPVAMSPRNQDDLEKISRQAMATFLKYDSSTMGGLRRAVLASDVVWKGMNQLGNSAQWDTLDGFPAMNSGQLMIIYGDWAVIHWWSGAVTKASSAVKSALAAAAAAGPDPRTDAAFNQAREHLTKVLGSMASLSGQALTPEWGEAAMFVSSGRHGVATMDVTWNSTTTHYGPAPV